MHFYYERKLIKKKIGKRKAKHEFKWYEVQKTFVEVINFLSPRTCVVHIKVEWQLFKRNIEEKGELQSYFAEKLNTNLITQNQKYRTYLKIVGNLPGQIKAWKNWELSVVEWWWIWSCNAYVRNHSKNGTTEKSTHHIWKNREVTLNINPNDKMGKNLIQKREKAYQKSTDK